jgi:hypothetical protein
LKTGHIRHRVGAKLAQFIVITGQGKRHTWDIPEGESVIGRDNQADLCLPNVSVSREHVRVPGSDADPDGTVVSVTDLNSSNGLMLNGKDITTAAMKTEDILQVGIFRLVLVASASPMDEALGNMRFYNGRAIEQMPPWKGVLPAGGSTHEMAAPDVERLVRKQHTIEAGRVSLVSDKSQYWCPGEGALTFGGSGMVQVDGLRARGIAAEIDWNGTDHVVTKKGLLGILAVNGQRASEQVLSTSDSIDICGTAFVYTIPKP